jgi:hypothetical protein
MLALESARDVTSRHSWDPLTKQGNDDLLRRAYDQSNLECDDTL